MVTKPKISENQITVTVLFFGVLAEVTGVPARQFAGVSTLDGIKALVSDVYPETVHYDFIVSVNNEVVRTDLDLSDADEVAFFPPFAGG